MKTWVLSHVLTLAFLATSQAWVLHTNHILVTPGSTPDVELICGQGNTPEAPAGISTISSIRITKQGPFGSEIAFVHIQAGHDMQSAAEEDDVKVAGKIKQDGTSFLKVKWQIANHNTPGAYSCEIDGSDTDGNSVSLHANPIVIKEKFLTADDVNELILSVTSGYERKQHALELEIAQLKTFIGNELNAKGQQISDVKETLASEISVISESILLKYATKTDVSFQISELRNFTLHEIMSERNHSSCHHICCDMNSTLSDLENGMLEKINSVEKDIKSTDVKLDNITDYFTEQVERIHLKTDLCCSDAFPTEETPTHSNRPTAGVSMPNTISTPATISTTNQVNHDLWPRGKYTMVRPRLGCPLSDNGKLIFYTFPYTLGSDTDNIDSLFKVNLRSGYRITTLLFCYRSTGSSSSTRWPQGSYCIGKSYSSCPEGFSKGERKQKIISETSNGANHFIGTYKEVYCCRSDGQANEPVTLPTRDPFYMYRYKGKCQEVKDMKVEEDSIFIWKETDVSTTLASKWTTPDVDSSGNVILCHYLKG